MFESCSQILTFTNFYLVSRELFEIYNSFSLFVFFAGERIFVPNCAEFWSKFAPMELDSLISALKNK